MLDRRGSASAGRGGRRACAGRGGGGRRRARPGRGRRPGPRPGAAARSATTTSAARATMKPSAPAPLPSRRLAPQTTSLITRQASTRRRPAPATPPSGALEQEADDEADHGGEQGHPAAGGAVGAGGAGEHADRDADAELGENVHVRNLTSRATSRRSATLPGMSEMPQPPHRRRAHTSTRDLERYAGLFAERTGVMRSSAMRDLMAITARPGGDLARRRPARHLDLPAPELRRADDPDRPGVGGRGAPVRADRGLRGDQGLHPRGDGRRGDAARPRRRDRHHRRPAGDRPGLQDAGRPRRRRDLRGADLPRRGAGLLQLPGRDDPDRVRRGRDADRRARSRCWTGWTARGGGRSSSTRCRASRTRPG